MKTKTPKRAGRKPAPSKSPIKLSTPASVRRLLALLSDKRGEEVARRRLQEDVDQLAEGAGVASLPQPEHAATFRAIVAEAARVVETAPARAKTPDRFARASYVRIAETLARVSAGESLADVRADLSARLESERPDSRTLAQLVKRGEEMIRDYDNFDADTRAMIDLSLQNIRDTQAGRLGEYADPEGDESKLREQITRAERGESLANFSGVKPEAAEAARGFIALMNHDGLPDYCRNSMTEVLSQLQTATSGGLWQTPHYTLGDSADEVGDWSTQTLARIFNNPPRDLPALKPELDLAGMISAVLRHPDTPGEVAEGLTDGLTSVFNQSALRGGQQTEFTSSPEYVGALLKYCGKEGGDE